MFLARAIKIKFGYKAGVAFIGYVVVARIRPTRHESDEVPNTKVQLFHNSQCNLQGMGENPLMSDIRVIREQARSCLIRFTTELKNG